MLMHTACTSLGLVLLILGAEVLVRGASKLAITFRVKPIIIGLTVVAFGTSSPEAIVSIYAVFKSAPNIAVGNIVGSNIFNIAFILGVAALVRPLKVDAVSLKREIPFVMLSALMLLFLGKDGYLGRIDGIILLIIFSIFLFVCFFKVSEKSSDNTSYQQEAKPKRFFQVIAGLLFLALGAKLFVRGSIGLATILGFSELFVGLTLIAAGTSLPELATSIVASYRKQDDISVGNISGSNIFNVLFILGIVSLITPITISQGFIARDIPVMIVISLVTLPILKTGFVISRLEGLCLVATYCGYIFWLIRSS